MLESTLNWFTSTALMPHGICLVWNRGLMGLHVVSDALIAASYYSIPFGLAFFVRRRRDLAYRWMFLLFAAFILACGTTHLFDIWTLWHPDYALQGIIKAVTAAISLSTAILLWPVLRQALALPSPKQLAQVNAELTQEIASRRELEDKLRQNEARLQAILDTAVEGILTIDAHGLVEMCNPAAARMFGYSPEEVLGRNVSQLMPPAYRDKHEAYVARYLATGEARAIGFGRELAGQRKDGSNFPLEVALGEFESGGGRHFTGILRDLTERKRLEERLQQQQAELLHVQRLSTAGELAAMMAHELNQPLGAITNYLGGVTLRFEAIMEANPALNEAVKETLRLAKRAADVVDGIRDLVRRRESEREWTHIGAVVEETLALVRPELDRRQIRLATVIPPELPRLWGQRVHLQQLLLNLMLNAMDAMTNTEASARRLTLEIRNNAGADIEIIITDTGTGFPPALAARLFEPFVTTKPEGLGLGLSICRSIVEAHGGRISARSVMGQGATFSIILPTEKEPGTHDH